VQAHLNADGSVQDARVYEQVALQGNGTVTIKNPVSTANLRNLDGFGAFEVKDGNIISTQTVNGEKRLRAVSDFGKVLPLKVAVTYKLDGKTVQAGDVVGKAGRLEVHYKVDNVTGKDQEVTYNDGTGKMVTETQKVVIPMVGSLSTVLPSTFTDVQSGEASMAGDGNGGTSMTFTMTLFGPIGSSTSEFGYSAAIQDGLIPDASISALPVSPLDNPSFKGGAASYKAGADTGVTLTAGATEIDANVLKLRDGAQTLLAGLIQLSDGAKTLNAGLAGEAAPGANALADGASKLKDGAGQLAAGLDTASAGAPSLLDGLDQVAGGLTARRRRTGPAVWRHRPAPGEGKADPRRHHPAAGRARRQDDSGNPDLRRQYCSIWACRRDESRRLTGSSQGRCRPGQFWARRRRRGARRPHDARPHRKVWGRPGQAGVGCRTGSLCLMAGSPSSCTA